MLANKFDENENNIIILKNGKWGNEINDDTILLENEFN